MCFPLLYSYSIIMFYFTNFNMTTYLFWSCFTVDDKSVERPYFLPIRSKEAKLFLNYSLNFCSSALNCNIKWWCSPHLAMFSYIGWIRKFLNVCEQLNLFDKLSLNNIFRVVNIHAILTRWLQSHWGLPTQIAASCTASFCFWCGHWPVSSSSHGLICFCCARALKRVLAALPISGHLS